MNESHASPQAARPERPRATRCECWLRWAARLLVVLVLVPLGGLGLFGFSSLPPSDAAPDSPRVDTNRSVAGQLKRLLDEHQRLTRDLDAARDRLTTLNTRLELAEKENQAIRQRLERVSQHLSHYLSEFQIQCLGNRKSWDVAQAGLEGADLVSLENNAGIQRNQRFRLVPAGKSDFFIEPSYAPGYWLGFTDDKSGLKVHRIRGLQRHAFTLLPQVGPDGKTSYQFQYTGFPGSKKVLECSDERSGTIRLADPQPKNLLQRFVLITRQKIDFETQLLLRPVE